MTKIPSTYEEFHLEREIPRLVEPPPLSAEEIETITRTLFVLPPPVPSDALFVFGSSSRQFERLAEAYRAGLFRRVLATGLPGRSYYETGKSLARTAFEELTRLGVPPDIILLEESSTNTLEEVERGVPILREHNVELENLIFACGRAHSGRCYRTLKRFLPDTTLTCIPFDSVKYGKALEEDTWHIDPVTRSTIYAEYLRVQTYAKRGDIASL